MDIYILISVLSVMQTWIVYTALCAPVEGTPTASTDAQQRRHVRTKRCSCATFMDNECVYFCHLDIIWVNTPERVVSYGLGNAPRTRRAVADSRATSSGPRCQCFSQNDIKCQTFCRAENHLRQEPSTDTVIRSAEGDGCAGAQCAQRQAADADRIRRMRIRAALKTRLLLKKWRARMHHRAKVWDGESTTS